MPIYYIIGAYVPNKHMYSVFQILKVFETTLEAVIRGDLEHATNEYCSQGLNVTFHLVLREPDNPFKDELRNQ